MIFPPVFRLILLSEIRSTINSVLLSARAQSKAVQLSLSTALISNTSEGQHFRIPLATPTSPFIHAHCRAVLLFASILPNPFVSFSNSQSIGIGTAGELGKILSLIFIFTFTLGVSILSLQNEEGRGSNVSNGSFLGIYFEHQDENYSTSVSGSISAPFIGFSQWNKS